MRVYYILVVASHFITLFFFSQNNYSLQKRVNCGHLQQHNIKVKYVPVASKKLFFLTQDDHIMIKYFSGQD